jgi:hypothetical protein
LPLSPYTLIEVDPLFRWTSVAESNSTTITYSASPVFLELPFSIFNTKANCKISIYAEGWFLLMLI